MRKLLTEFIGAISGGGGYGNLPLHWLGPLAGGALAAPVFKFQEE